MSKDSNKKMPKNNFFLKVNLTKEERERNMSFFLKFIEAILIPVFIGILAGWGSPITLICAIVWELGEFISLFYDSEALVIEIIWSWISSS